MIWSSTVKFVQSGRMGHPANCDHLSVLSEVRPQSLNVSTRRAHDRVGRESRLQMVLYSPD
jgi:hypothetical protein